MFYKIFLAVIVNLISVTMLFAEAGTEQLARDALEQSVMTQDQVNLLEKQLSAKLDNITILLETAIIKKYDNVSIDNNTYKIDAETAYKKAQNLSSLGQIRQALVYYLIATYTDPTEPKYILTYFKTVIISAENLAKDKQYEEAYNRLIDLEIFMMNSLNIIPLKISDDLVKYLTDIEMLKREYQHLIKEDSKRNLLNEQKILITEADIILDENIPQTLFQTEQYLKRAESVASALMRSAVINPSAKVDELINELGRKLITATNILEIERSLKRGEDILKTFNIKKNTPFATQILSEVAFIGQRLSSLSDFASISQKERIAKFTEEFLTVADNFNQESSAKEFDRLKIRFDAINKTLIKNRNNAEKSLAVLYQLQDEIIVDSAKISAPKYLKEIRSLLNQLTKEINAWQEIQLRAYERFAVGKIRDFYNLYSKELGVLGSGRDTKTKIYLGMKDYLCPIEVRYLSAVGNKVYSEVFDYFYKELDRDQRIKLSAEFIDCEKKPLTEF